MPTETPPLSLIVLVAAGILILILAYFIITIVREQRRVLRWQQERIKAEVETLEQERRRIAGDLHDELGPMLSAIKMQMNFLEPSDATEKAVLGKSSGQIDNVIQRFREISYNLMPNTLVRRGLVRAADEFIEKMSAVNGMEIVFNHSDPESIKLEPEQELNLFRMIQEITHNAMKHAQAKHLQIELKRESNGLLFQTRDDGVGFLYEEKSRQSKGLGLMNLQSRAEILGGKLEVQTAPGKGTMYRVMLRDQRLDSGN